MKPAASLGRQAQQMNEGIEKGWRLSHTVRPEEIRSVAMPEPKHRIGPAGVSSDVTLHELPKARLEDLTKICQHYEQKCRGINSSDSEAARCLFELSREIQQVVLTLTQEESDRTLAAEKEEKWFKEEWEKIFGPDASLIQDASSIEIPLPCDGVSSAGEAENSKDAEHNKSREAVRKPLSEVHLGQHAILTEGQSREAVRKPLSELHLGLQNRQHAILTEGQCRKGKGGEDLEQRERAEVSKMREHFPDQSSRQPNVETVETFQTELGTEPREGERLQLPDEFRRLQHLRRRPDTVQDGAGQSPDMPCDK